MQTYLVLVWKKSIRNVQQKHTQTSVQNIISRTISLLALHWFQATKKRKKAARYLLNPHAVYRGET